jgi:cell wall assembly regulator SMI1
MQPTELCKAIRQRCAAEHWYGPDNRWVLPAGEDDRCRFGFALPPLTEEQVDQAETTLSFSLSPALRALYTQLANGGFGPHYGLFRLAGEHSENDLTVVEWHQEYSSRCRFFELEDQVQPGKGITFADVYWPRAVLPICEEGCGNYFCLDAITGHILTAGIWGAHEYCLAYVADSLEQWLQSWIDGTGSSQKE